MDPNVDPSTPRRTDGSPAERTPAPAAEPATERTTTAPAAEPATERTTTAPASQVPAETASTVEPTRVTLDASLDEHQRQGITGGTWIALILGALVLILLLIFILQNNVAAQFAYFGWEFSLPLGIAMLFAAIAGVLITGLLGSVRLFKLSRRVRKLEKERATIKRAIG